MALVPLNDLQTFFRFYSGVYRNKKGQEITNSLKTAFADSLMQYHDVNNCFPDKIVVFRDGVGDGDLLAVLNHEVRWHVFKIDDLTHFTSFFRSLNF